MSPTLKHLTRRLGIHKRRMRYWSGVPSFSGYGPSGPKLQAGHMDMKYEEACEDAMGIAQALESSGISVRIVDIKATFSVRWHDPKAAEILLWPCA